jgi:hypothetical protein
MSVSSRQLHRNLILHPLASMPSIRLPLWASNFLRYAHLNFFESEKNPLYMFLGNTRCYYTLLLYYYALAFHARKARVLSSNSCDLGDISVILSHVVMPSCSLFWRANSANSSFLSGFFIVGRSIVDSDNSPSCSCIPVSMSLMPRKEISAHSSALLAQPECIA